MSGRKICIIGFSEATRWWVKDQPRTVELWGLNEAHNCTIRINFVDDLGRKKSEKCPCYNPHKCICMNHEHDFMPHYDRWFQIHRPDHNEQRRIEALAKTGSKLHPKDTNAYGRNERHVKFLQECDRPLYMLHGAGRFPTSIKYPFGKVQNAFGTPWNGRKLLYATSSPAYMIAPALYEHKQGQTISEIRFAGIELAIGTEYFWQRPCFEYYLGMAQGMGIKIVRAPVASTLLSAPRYAWDDPIEQPKDFNTAPTPIFMPTEEEIKEHGGVQEIVNVGE